MYNRNDLNNRKKNKQVPFFFSKYVFLDWRENIQSSQPDRQRGGVRS